MFIWHNIHTYKCATANSWINWIINKAVKAVFNLYWTIKQMINYVSPHVPRTQHGYDSNKSSKSFIKMNSVKRITYPKAIWEEQPHGFIHQTTLVCSLPVSIDSVVVLPAPLWPSRTVIWPSNMLRVKSLTASLVLLPTLNTCDRTIHMFTFSNSFYMSPSHCPYTHTHTESTICPLWISYY